MKTSVKIIKCETTEDLQKAINQWIKERKDSGIIIEDIKYSSSLYNDLEPGHQFVNEYSAMIIYEEKSKDDIKTENAFARIDEAGFLRFGGEIKRPEWIDNIEGIPEPVEIFKDVKERHKDGSPAAWYIYVKVGCVYFARRDVIDLYKYSQKYFNTKKADVRETKRLEEIFGIITFKHRPSLKTGEPEHRKIHIIHFKEGEAEISYEDLCEIVEALNKIYDEL